MTTDAPPIQRYVGQLITVQAKFTNLAGKLTDPTDALLSYRDAAGKSTLVQLALSALTKVDVGVYTVNLDTELFVTGLWDVQIVGIGAVAAVDVVQFILNPRPLG